MEFWAVRRLGGELKRLGVDPLWICRWPYSEKYFIGLVQLLIDHGYYLYDYGWRRILSATHNQSDWLSDGVSVGLYELSFEPM